MKTWQHWCRLVPLPPPLFVRSRHVMELLRTRSSFAIYFGLLHGKQPAGRERKGGREGLMDHVLLLFLSTFKIGKVRKKTLTHATRFTSRWSFLFLLLFLSLRDPIGSLRVVKGGAACDRANNRQVLAASVRSSQLLIRLICSFPNVQNSCGTANKEVVAI